MQATVLRPGEGETIGGPTTVTLKATGEETNDSFYLGESILQPGFPGPPPHRHRTLHDMFYVLDGTLTMRLGDDTLGWENYMRDLGTALAAGTPTQQEIGEIASRYDFEVV